MEGICLLHEVGTEGSDSEGAGSEGCSNAARNGWGSRISDIVWGSGRFPVGAAKESAVIRDKCGSVSDGEGESLEDGDPIGVDRSSRQGCPLVSDVAAMMLSRE